MSPQMAAAGRPTTTGPAPAIALDTPDEPLAIVVDLDQRKTRSFSIARYVDTQTAMGLNRKRPNGRRVCTSLHRSHRSPRSRPTTSLRSRGSRDNRSLRSHGGSRRNRGSRDSHDSRGRQVARPSDLRHVEGRQAYV